MTETRMNDNKEERDDRLIMGNIVVVAEKDDDTQLLSNKDKQGCTVGGRPDTSLLQHLFEEYMEKKIQHLEAIYEGKNIVLNDDWLDLLGQSSAELSRKSKELCRLRKEFDESRQTLHMTGWKGDFDRKRKEHGHFHDELSRQEEAQWIDWAYLDKRLNELENFTVLDWACDFSSYS